MSQFDKISPSVTDTYGSPYDLKSLMHYDGYAFSISKKEKPTIVDK